MPQLSTDRIVTARPMPQPAAETRDKPARQTSAVCRIVCTRTAPRKASRNVRSPAHNEFAVEQSGCSTANSIRTSVAIPYGTSIDFLAVVFALVRCHFDLQGDHADRRHSGLVALVAVLAPARRSPAADSRSSARRRPPACSTTASAGSRPASRPDTHSRNDGFLPERRSPARSRRPHRYTRRNTELRAPVRMFRELP